MRQLFGAKAGAFLMQSVWVFFSFFARQYLVGDPVFRYKTKTLQKGSDTKKQSVLITLFSMLLFCFYFKKNKNTHNLIFFPFLSLGSQFEVE